MTPVDTGIKLNNVQMNSIRTQVYVYLFFWRNQVYVYLNRQKSTFI
jgi:hypothetical protein